MREGHLAFLVEAVVLEVCDDPDSFVSNDRRYSVGDKREGRTSDYQP